MVEALMCTTCDEQDRQDNERAALESLTHYQRLVLDLVNREACWLTSETLAEKLDRSKASVVGALNVLIRLHLIQHKRYNAKSIIFASNAVGV
jgi:hypothetical protein